MTDQRCLHLDLAQEKTADCVRRKVTLRADGESAPISILYEIFDSAVSELVVLDGLVQGVLLHCMQRGLPLRVHGDLSRSALYNLHELQRFWVRWKPKLYTHVDLLPDGVVTERPRSTRAIQAFSGGVDASFTLISNKYLHQERGGYDITAAVLVHGFDVAYDNHQDFATLAARARETLEHFGVELKLVRTNSRSQNLQSWLDSNSMQLFACLHQFSSDFGTALAGSAAPYDGLSMPTGANPTTDHLLSGDLMSAIHDGAGYSRTEKVEALAQYPFLVERLRVCWQGRVQHENCGRCEKCLRTRLNFAAIGDNEPACFPGPFKIPMLRKLRARSNLQMVELEGIQAYVQRRGLAYPWDHALRRQIFLSRYATPVENALGWPKIRPVLRRAVLALRPGRSR